MPKPNIQMTRDQMQNEALIIESLLSAAMAMHTGDDPNEALSLIEKAHDRAENLNRALDAVNVINAGKAA